MGRMTMAGSTVLLLMALLGAYVGAEPEGTGGAIAWMSDLEGAFKKAVEEQKVVMICINAKNPIGEPQEPAAKGLREVVYKDPAVVSRSREFVCVLLTASGSSDDYGELRARFGVEGLIVSPQHIFAHPKHADGEKPLVRMQYWRYGSGEEAVKALIGLMDKALAAYRVRQGMPEGSESGGAPQTPAERKAWVEKLISLIQGKDAAVRQHALKTLSKEDKDGDCVGPLIPLLQSFNAAKQTDALIDVVRALGIPELEQATPILHELLKHKEPRVRATVAVTLEYIGSSASTAPLLARVKREKDEKIANHMYRAIGRCAAGDAAARKKLLRRAQPGKGGDFGSFGPVIGLAYFEGDAKLARSLEKQMLKLGSPFQEGSKAHAFLRAAIVWCLSEIRDPKTATFLRKKVLKPLEKEESHWKAGIFAFYGAVARKCEGSDDAQTDIDRGISWYLWTDNARELVDEYRRGRDMERFRPKGEWGNTTEDD